jgi:hypothetical protein
MAEFLRLHRKPLSVILRCEPEGRASKDARPLNRHLLRRPGRRPSRLAALAPQGDGLTTELASALGAAPPTRGHAAHAHATGHALNTSAFWSCHAQTTVRSRRTARSRRRGNGGCLWWMVTSSDRNSRARARRPPGCGARALAGRLLLLCPLRKARMKVGFDACNNVRHNAAPVARSSTADACFELSPPACHCKSGLPDLQHIKSRKSGKPDFRCGAA